MFEKVAAIAKHELKWMGTFGMAAQLGGTVFVQRSKKENASKTIDGEIIDHKKDDV